MSLSPSTLLSSIGPNADMVTRSGYADALAAEGVELDREAGRRPLLADRRRPGRDLVAALPGHAEPGEVALDVGREDRDAVRAQLLGEQLQGLGLAGAGRARDQSVAVEHPERDPDADVGELGRVEHQPAELEGRALEGVAGPHGGGDRVLGTAAGTEPPQQPSRRPSRGRARSTRRACPSWREPNQQAGALGVRRYSHARDLQARGRGAPLPRPRAAARATGPRSRPARSGSTSW